jgi:hypothetical protein
VSSVADAVDDGGESRAAKGCGGRRNNRILRRAIGTLNLAHSHRLRIIRSREGSEGGGWPSERVLGLNEVQKPEPSILLYVP